MTNISANGYGQIDQFHTPSKWGDVLADKAWRHTIGRVSMLARIPVYLVALGLQTAKIPAKMVIAPVATTINWATHGKHNKTLDSWTFKGVAKDSLIWVKLVDKIASSTLGVIFAPPKQYIPFDEAVKKTFKVVKGDYHFFKQTTMPTKVSDIAKLVEMRPEFHRHIFDHNSLNNSVILRSGSVSAG